MDKNTEMSDPKSPSRSEKDSQADPQLELEEREIEANSDSRHLYETFRAGVLKLEEPDREQVLAQFAKLKEAFSTLGSAVNKILSSEEGRRLFEQEAKKARGD